MSHRSSHAKENKRFKKRYIIIPTSILLAVLFMVGGWVLSKKVWGFISSLAGNGDTVHNIIASARADSDDRILVRLSEDSDPIYIDAVDGMPVNTYDDDSFYLDDNGLLAYSHNGEKISTVGIDVSYVQGDIDWFSVRDAGVDYAVIRCGGRGYGDKGILFTDEKFVQNIEGAVNAGLDVGVYFYSQAVTVAEAEEEADYVLDLIKDYDIKYPVVFDWERYEYDEARTDDIDGQTLTDIALAFCSKIKQAGYSPMIYANRSQLYNEYDLSRMTELEFWLASYESRPDYYYEFGIWQYTTEGQIDGIEGNVDLNICLYDYGNGE